MPAGLQGQSNIDFAGSWSALRILHLGIRNDVGTLTTDAFTQTNPPIVTTAPPPYLATITKRGVLGGSVTIARPDIGNGYVGGPISSPTGNNRPLGIFINDAVGNPFENAPGPASQKGPHVNGMGSYASKLFETLQQTTTGGGSVGDALTAYATGQPLYCSVNGFITNRVNDSIEVKASISAASVIPLAHCVVPWSTSFPELVFNLRV